MNTGQLAQHQTGQARRAHTAARGLLEVTPLLCHLGSFPRLPPHLTKGMCSSHPAIKQASRHAQNLGLRLGSRSDISIWLICNGTSSSTT